MGTLGTYVALPAQVPWARGPAGLSILPGSMGAQEEPDSQQYAVG